MTRRMTSVRWQKDSPKGAAEFKEDSVGGVG